MMETSCGRCGGSGQISFNRSQQCPRCYGSGRIVNPHQPSSNAGSGSAGSRKPTGSEKREARQAEYRRQKEIAAQKKKKEAKQKQEKAKRDRELKKELKRREAWEKKYGKVPESSENSQPVIQSKSKDKSPKPPVEPWDGDLRWAALVGLVVAILVGIITYRGTENPSLWVAVVIGGICGVIAGRFYKFLLSITVIGLLLYLADLFWGES